MTSRIFVDTNVFIYARDRRLAEKQPRAQAWLRRLGDLQAGVTSPQVAGEFLNVLSKGKLVLDDADLRATMALIELWSAGETDIGLVTKGWQLRTETGFQFWDCVVLGSAIRSGCRYLLSEDYQSGRTVEGVTIISPFGTDPTILEIN